MAAEALYPGFTGTVLTIERAAPDTDARLMPVEDSTVETGSTQPAATVEPTLTHTKVRRAAGSQLTQGIAGCAMRAVLRRGFTRPWSDPNQST